MLRRGLLPVVAASAVAGRAAAVALSTRAAALALLKFKLADLHEGLAEVDVRDVLVKEGDKIREFQDLLFVTTDKASTEISSPVAGTILKAYCKGGDTVKVGEVLFDIDTDGPVVDVGTGSGTGAAGNGGGASKAAASGSGSHTTGTDEHAIETRHGRRIVPATPAVRGLARKHSIDLASVAGTGRDGRVLKGDLLRVVAGGPAKPVVEAASSPAAAPAVAPAAAPASPAAKSATASGGAAAVAVVPARATRPDTRERITGMRKGMVKSMEESLSIPHFGYKDEVLVGALADARSRLKATAERYGLKLTLMPFFIKAASMALAEYPVLNASLSADKTEVVYRGSHNISVAMDTRDGLVVPNIKAVEQLSVLQIGLELNRLQALGAAGRLARADLEGGTFSLSNIGNIGGTYMDPVIMSPQVAIGALGQIRTLPRFKADGSVVAAKVLYISWAGDHRVIDGATMARFSNRWKDYVENPETMLLELK